MQVALPRYTAALASVCKVPYVRQVERFVYSFYLPKLSELLHFPTDNESIHRVRVPIYDNAEATLYPYFKVNFEIF